MRLLLVEDDFDLSASLCDYLEAQSYLVDCAYTAASAYELLKQHTFEALILDINLPDYSGFRLCDRIKTELMSEVPVIMLTARSEIEDKLVGFSHGADDYLVKPFEMAELKARINVMINRRLPLNRVISVAGLSYDLNQELICFAGEKIELNSSCRKILRVLMQHSPNIVAKKDLEYALWGEDVPETDALKIHMHSLRQKLEPHGISTNIKTVRGSGYCLHP